MTNPNFLPVTESAALQILNSNTVFEEYLRAQKNSGQVRGGMYWKKQGPYEYLVRTAADNSQVRIGDRSPETEKIYEDFIARKAALEQRLASLKSSLGEAERLNKAVKAGRVPTIVIKLLNRLRAEGLDRHFTIVGTHAMYAYEAAAGIRIVPSALATQDVDLLWDARKRVSFVTDLAKTEDKSILRILQRVDSSFERKELTNETAINSKGFEVDFLRREQQGDDPHPWRFSGDEDDLWPVQARRANLLTDAPRFSSPVIGLNGEMAMMNTISPTAFVKFKTWLASEVPDRPTLKRARDRHQAEIVKQLLEEEMLFEQEVPSMAAQQRERGVEAEVRDALREMGFTQVERSGVDGIRHIGPVIQVNDRFVAQSVGRSKAVIHDVRALKHCPTIGQNVEILFKAGRGEVVGFDSPGATLER